MVVGRRWAWRIKYSMEYSVHFRNKMCIFCHKIIQYCDINVKHHIMRAFKGDDLQIPFFREFAPRPPSSSHLLK